MTRVEALEAAKQATIDYVAAAESDDFDEDELDWLELYQVRMARQAVTYGCDPAAVKAALIQAVKEVVNGHA